MKSNIALIGMSACGKSTVGVLLAKTLNMAFLDTDLLIQQKHGMFLWQLLERSGIGGFLSWEEDAISSLSCEGTCIATGGSVVYSEKSMTHLKNISSIVFIDVPPDEIARRVGDIKSRGIVIEPGKTLAGLYAERLPLYRKYADFTVNADAQSAEDVVHAIKCLNLKQ